MKKDYYEIIKDNEWLIYSIAKKYLNYNNMDDLYQAGSIGIIKAYKKYNEDSNVKFSTYAYKYILGEMIDFIRKDKSIIVSDEVYDIYKKYNKIKDLLCFKYNREVSFNEICSYMNIDEKQMLSIIESISYSKSIDESLYDYIPNNNEFTFDDIVINSEIDMLNEFDKSLIDYRYYQGYSQEETARLLGISQAKASRCERLILNKMRENITN